MRPVAAVGLVRTLESIARQGCRRGREQSGGAKVVSAGRERGEVPRQAAVGSAGAKGAS